MHSFRILIILSVFLLVSLSALALSPLPTPIPGNPQYLVRVIYVIPTDRLLDYNHYPDSPLYNAKVNNAVLRIRTAMETLDDFVDFQINNVHPVTDPEGDRINFERELEGKGPIRVIILHGSRTTRGTDGYWGDEEGFAGHLIFARIADDVIPSITRIDDTRKTIHMIICDTTEWDNTIGKVRGHAGGGMPVNYNSCGWGGYSMTSGCVLPFLPADPGDPASRKNLLETALSSSSQEIIIPNPYTGVSETWNLKNAASPDQISTNRFLSLFHGVMGHELLHSFGLGHCSTAIGEKYMGIMSLGYKRFGHGVSMMYGFSDNAYPFDPPGTTVHKEITDIHPFYCLHLSRSPYLRKNVDPDKTDPESCYGFPSYGYVWPSSPENIISIGVAEDPGGSEACGSFAFSGGNIKDMVEASLVPGTPEILSFSKFPADCHISFKSGANFMNVLVQDKAGNIVPNYIQTFIMEKSGEVKNNAVFVAPPGAARDPGSEKGSWLNPYSSIQEAIDTVKADGAGTVFFKNGTYPVTESIKPRQRVNLIGLSVGGVLLDGGGAVNLPLIVSNDVNQSNFSSTSYANPNVIANLVLANAGWGIRKGSTLFNSHNFRIANCVFYNMDKAGVDISHLSGTVSVIQNTLVDCNSGILLHHWPDIGDPREQLVNPKYVFELKNNIVYHTGGTGTIGIQLDDILSFRSKRRSGWNNVYGYSHCFKGSYNYDTARLEGEISKPVDFILDTPLDFRLQTASPGVGEGDPLTRKSSGARRDMGAFFDALQNPLPYILLAY